MCILFIYLIIFSLKLSHKRLAIFIIMHNINLFAYFSFISFIKFYNEKKIDLESSIHLLFRNLDISQVGSYLYKGVMIGELIFSKILYQIVDGKWVDTVSQKRWIHQIFLYINCEFIGIFKTSCRSPPKIATLKNIIISFEMADEEDDDGDGDILIKLMLDFRNQINKVPKVCYQHSTLYCIYETFVVYVYIYFSSPTSIESLAEIWSFSKHQKFKSINITYFHKFLLRYSIQMYFLMSKLFFYFYKASILLFHQFSFLLMAVGSFGWPSTHELSWLKFDY